MACRFESDAYVGPCDNDCLPREVSVRIRKTPKLVVEEGDDEVAVIRVNQWLSLLFFFFSLDFVWCPSQAHRLSSGRCLGRYLVLTNRGP